MAVYREGFHAISEIQKSSVQIFSDSCDFGAPCKKGDRIWNLAKQLVDWYKLDGTRKEWSMGVTNDVKLIDEWAVSDERKTLNQATEIYRVSYNKTTSGRCKGFDGYISIEKMS